MRQKTFSVVFRCDAGRIKGLGTGHLYRCIAIANLIIKKFRVPKKKILFITKTNKNFSSAKKILLQNKFKIHSLKNRSNINVEYMLLKSIKSKLLIFDKYKLYNTSYISKLKKNFNKIVLLDSMKHEDKDLLYINSLFLKIKKKNYSHVGYNYSICPSFLHKKATLILKKNITKIFLFFGGYDNKNIMKKVISYFFRNSFKYHLYLPKIYKKYFNKKNKIKYFDNKNIYKSLQSSDLAITSGGLIMFDVINLNKPLITIPQYKHQSENIKKLYEKKTLFQLKLNKNFNTNLSNLLTLMKTLSVRKKMVNNQKKILSSKKKQKALELIYNAYKNK